MKAKFLFLLVALPLALAECDESETGRTAPAATRADAGGEQGVSTLKEMSKAKEMNTVKAVKRATRRKGTWS